MTHLKWPWILSPLGFGPVYAFITFFVWMPLARPHVVARWGETYVAYWEGVCAANVAFEIVVAAVLVAPVFCVFAPRKRFVTVVFSGVVWGVLTSVFTYLGGTWALKYLDIAGFFLIPLFAAIILILCWRWKQIIPLANELRAIRRT